MSRTKNHLDVVTFKGQNFYQKTGKVFGKPTWFSSDARKVVNRNTGEISELEETKRVVISVINEGSFEKLDAMSFEQLSLAAGKTITPDDLLLLRNADLLYYVSERKQGQEYYYRPDVESDNNKQIAQRSGEFTSVFGIAVADQYADKFEELPDYAGHARFTADDEKAVKAQAELIKQEQKETAKEVERDTDDTPAEETAKTPTKGAKKAEAAAK